MRGEYRAKKKVTKTLDIHTQYAIIDIQTEEVYNMYTKTTLKEVRDNLINNESQHIGNITHQGNSLEDVLHEASIFLSNKTEDSDKPLRTAKNSPKTYVEFDQDNSRLILRGMKAFKLTDRDVYILVEELKRKEKTFFLMVYKIKAS